MNRCTHIHSLSLLHTHTHTHTHTVKILIYLLQQTGCSHSPQSGTAAGVPACRPGRSTGAPASPGAGRAGWLGPPARASGCWGGCAACCVPPVWPGRTAMPASPAWPCEPPGHRKTPETCRVSKTWKMSLFTHTNSHTHVEILAWLCQVQPSIKPFAASGHNFPDWLKKCEPPEPQKHSWNTQGEWDIEDEVLHRLTHVLSCKFWPNCLKSNLQLTPLLPQAVIFQTELKNAHKGLQTKTLLGYILMQILPRARSNTTLDFTFYCPAHGVHACTAAKGLKIDVCKPAILTATASTSIQHRKRLSHHTLHSHKN